MGTRRTAMIFRLKPEATLILVAEVTLVLVAEATPPSPVLWLPASAGRTTRMTTAMAVTEATATSRTKRPGRWRFR